MLPCHAKLIVWISLLLNIMPTMIMRVVFWLPMQR
jgi:hypothetical protein